MNSIYKMLTHHVMLIFLVIVFLNNIGYAAGEYLQTDKGTKAWNLDPGPGMSGVWSGSADANGYAVGEGTLKLYKNGNLYVIYEGKMLRGKLEGSGKIEYAKGGKFECNFVNGSCTGKGQYVFANGNRYEGDLVNFEPSGQGIFISQDGSRYQGGFKNGVMDGHGTLEYPSGEKYVGGFVKGKVHGSGSLTLPDQGKIVEGEWRNDKMVSQSRVIDIPKITGQGVLVLADGRYEGSLVEGKQHGQGAFVYKDGSRYEGSWEKGYYHGKGIMIYKNGNRYEGDWVGGKRNGYGVFKWINGDRYEGEWRNDQRNGQAVLTLADGTVKEGQWIDDIRQISISELAEKYPVGTKVSVIRWSRIFGDNYGYAGIVREIDGADVTLEVVAFINVNRDVEATAASGGKRLIKGQDIGTQVVTNLRYITGYYQGDIQAKSPSPMNLSGDYTIENQYDSSDNKMRIYSLKCSETGAWAEVLYFYNSQSYTWRTFDKKNRHWPEYNISFHQVAIKACRGIVD